VDGKKILLALLATILLSAGAFGGWTQSDTSEDVFKDMELQNTSKANIHPQLEAQFEDQPAITTQETEKKEIIVNLGQYSQNPDIKEMQKQAEESQKPLKQLAERKDSIEIKNNFWISNTIVLEADTNLDIEDIARIQGVQTINPNFEAKTLEQLEPSSQTHNSAAVQSRETTYGLEQINATETWDHFGTKGDNVKVAVLDTGVGPDHPDIDIKDENWAEFDDDGSKISGSQPSDCEEHGTHVSGTVVGGDESGEHIGVAPDAELMHGGVLMLEEDCGGTISSIIAGIEWAVDNDADFISASLGIVDPFSGQSTYIDELIDPVKNANNNGAYFIAAIGNDDEGTTSSPGNIYDAFSVGATDSSYDVAGFSGGELVEDGSWGDAPSSWPDEYITPDVVAPGVGVKSAVPDDDWDWFDGTSMATPHVAGAAALMQSATSETLSPSEIDEAFEETAWKPSDWDKDDAAFSEGEQDTRYGYGIIDAYAATDYALNEFDLEPSSLGVENVNAEAGVEDTVSVQVKDEDENKIESSRFEVVVENDDGLQDLDNSASTNAEGIAEFTFEEAEAREYNLDFKLDGDDSVTGSGVVEIEASNPSELSSENVSITAGEEENILLELVDGFDNRVEGERIEVEHSGGLSNLEGSKETDKEGEASFSFEEENASQYNPVFRLESDTAIETSPAIKIHPAEASNLKFANQPSTTRVGEQILDEQNKSITVNATDEFGNLDESFNEEVTIRIKDGEDLQTNTSENGETEFEGIKIKEAGKYELKADSIDVASAISNEFEVLPGPAKNLELDSQPEDSVAGKSIQGSPSVKITDLEGNAIEDVEVTASLNNGELSGGQKTNLTNDKGEAEFKDLTINKTGIYTLDFSIDERDQNVAENISKESEEFEIAPAEAEKFEFSEKTGELTAGESYEFAVQTLDQFRNPSANHTGFQDFIAVSSGELKNPESIELDEENSETSFEWKVTEKGNQTINTDTELEDATHNLEVSPGEISAEKSTISSESSELIADEEFNTTVVLDAIDKYGNNIQIGGEENIELQTTEGKLLEPLKDQEDGTYTQTLQASNELGKTKVTGTFKEEKIESDTSIIFTAGETSIINSSVGQKTVADGEETITATINLEDDFDNPIPDKKISLQELDESLNLDGDKNKTTDEDGATDYVFNTTNAGNYTINFTTNNGLETSEKLVFIPGPADYFELTGVEEEQSIGEEFELNITAFDKENNLATDYTNKTELTLENADEHANILLEQTTNFTEGIGTFSPTINNNQTLENINIKAVDQDITGSSEKFNLTKPAKPEIEMLDANASLMLENEVLDIGINRSLYEFEENESKTSLNISKPEEEKKQLDLSSKQEGLDFNSTYQPQELGDYNLDLYVEDIFGQNKSEHFNFSVRTPKNVSATINRSEPDWTLKTNDGKIREQNQGDVNTTVPSDDEWSLEIAENNAAASFSGINVSENVNESIDFQPDTKLDEDIDLFNEEQAVAANTSLNASKTQLSVESETDTVYRCGEWDFDSETCNSSWSKIDSSKITSENGKTILDLDGFSAYSFGQQGEEEDETDEEDDSSGSSSGGSGGGGLGGAPPPEPELQVEENQDEIKLYNIHEPDRLEFNQTELPVKALEWDSSPDNGTINFKLSDTQDDTVSFEHYVEADSDFESNFSLEFSVSNEWIEDNNFEQEEITMFNPDKKEAELINQTTEDSVYLVELEELADFGLGVDQACYSTESVNASDGESCESFDNICEVPDGWEETGRCEEDDSVNELENEVSERFNRLKQEDPQNEMLETINQSIQSGDYEEASKTLDTVEEDKSGFSLIYTVLGIIGVILITSISLVIYRNRSRNTLVSELNQLTEMVSDLPNTNENREILKKLGKANQAAIEEDWDRVERLIAQIKKMLQQKI